MFPSSARLTLLAFLIGSAFLRGQDAPKSGEAALIEAENDVTAKKGAAPWQKAAPTFPLAVGDKVRTGKKSRAAVRLTDLSVMRLDQITVFEIGSAAGREGLPSIDLKQGGAYFFSRERAPEMHINTPAANGALRGTQLVVRVTPALKTLMTVMEGQVELSNAQGSVSLGSGEQGEAEVGKAPRKTAVINAVNILQWALYYPGVLDPRELGMSAAEQRAVAASLAAYRAGDLLGALEKYPANYRPSSGPGRLYYAGVLLAVGRVDDAQQIMSTLSADAAGRRALDQMIAAVKFQDWSRTGADISAHSRTAGEWMAESYYLQSKSQLEPAREAARKATEVAPDFGYAWVRMAELEFSFGRTPQALKALQRGLELTPDNAQGHALRGFLLSAQNRINPARDAFSHAIMLDGALGNAWLGRGLTYIRQGHDETGRQDLQVAATLEPNRSILHSYLGKAFSQIGDTAAAQKDLARAKELDPNDPTPWLYSAIENKQENRYNAAVRDLEQSIALNDNRRVYRSQFLLDQDRAVRGANLAAIYRNEGMVEQSVREAVRSVNSDYASASAHLFLANSYNELRDPRRVLLRYETPWFNELLLANLLSPVGGGPLSQYVSQQEYSKLFERDGLGISSVTDYFSTGELRETASQFGTFGNFSYALDAEDQYDNGLRPNNEISRLESYATFKLQLGPQDTIFFQTKYEHLHLGDVFQRYDARGFRLSTQDRTFDFTERQEPALILLGFHHEWNPGVHTLLLFGRLANDQVLTAEDTNQFILTRSLGQDAPDLAGETSFGQVRHDLRGFLGEGKLVRIDTLPFDLDYRANFETYSAELNQIVQVGPHAFVLGGRYQQGQFTTQALLPSDAADAFRANEGRGLFDMPPAHQNLSVDFQRFNLYAYDIWRVTPWFSLTAGLVYDDITYPENFRSAPVNDREAKLERLSPKAGLILTPFRGTTLRAAYTEAVTGPSFDESVRLEPTQVAGFSQSFRNVVSESVAGELGGSRFRNYGVSLEQKLPSLTYLGLEVSRIEQNVDRVIGVFDFFQEPFAALPSSLKERIEYREDMLLASVNQLVGDNWVFGTRYRVTKSDLRRFRPNVPRAVFREADLNDEAVLHELGLYALFNHPSGFFARAEANWYNQENESRPRALEPLSAAQIAAGTTPRVSGADPQPGDSFWQFNVFAGYRFYRNQCEVSCGLLNITGEDYRLNPINPYVELPRDRTLLVRVKFTF